MGRRGFLGTQVGSRALEGAKWWWYWVRDQRSPEGKGAVCIETQRGWTAWEKEG